MAFQHEYYVHPTCFDRYNSACSEWMLKRYTGSRPYLWFWAFSLLALLCYLGFAWIAYQFVLDVRQDGGINGLHAIANTVAAAMALGGAVQFHRLARQIGLLDARAPDVREEAGNRVVQRQQNVPVRLTYQQEVRQFFSTTRQAGVDVATAKELFSAGIRTMKQLQASDDETLLDITGVDDAILKRLRHSAMGAVEQ
ncbi:MAG: helix-hairpin-helix domain-containing protein [Gammaproteobacteria bacterium]